MLNLESVRQNKTHEILWDFEIQTDYRISTRLPDLVIVNKRNWTCQIVDFAVPVEHRIKLKEKRKTSTLQENQENLWNLKMHGKQSSKDS